MRQPDPTANQRKSDDDERLGLCSLNFAFSWNRFDLDCKRSYVADLLKVIANEADTKRVEVSVYEASSP